MHIPHKRLLVPALVGVVAGVVLEGPLKGLWSRATGMISGIVSGPAAPKKPEGDEGDDEDEE